MTRKLSRLSNIFVFILTLALCGCAADVNDTDTSTNVYDATLAAGEDMGREYIDSFIFIGESTTYHLKSRGVLSGGTDTTQVWGTRSGTANLDTTIASLKIVYPETDEELTVAEAVAKKKPQRIILTFGLNGAVSKIRNGEEYFKKCYLLLIDAIRNSYADTEIYIQSCFPVAKNMDTINYGVDVSTLNSYIRTLNSWALSLANEQGLFYLDTQEVLLDADGCLKDEYQAGDGYHLNTEAYECVIKYIRTHSPKE